MMYYCFKSVVNKEIQYNAIQKSAKQRLHGKSVPTKKGSNDKNAQFSVH